jgi:hypothetical protein
VLCDKFGNEKESATMKDVMVVPTCGYNLFSMTKMLLNGWELNGKDKEICLQKGKNRIVFDICIKTPKGMLLALYFKRGTERANASADAIHEHPAVVPKWSYQQAHDRLGHCSEEMTQKIANYLGLTITRDGAKPCAACAAAKAKQKAVPKNPVCEKLCAPVDKPDKDNGRIYLDISTVKPEKGEEEVSKPHWRIMVDEWTQLKFSDFFKFKNDMPEPTCEQFKKWEQAGKAVKIL